MNINGLKGIIIVLIFTVTFIFSMIPVFFVNHIHHTHNSSQRSKYHHILSYLSCVAGGVFMGTCILDLFPDVQEQIDILMSHYTGSRPFPVAEFVVVFGFLLVLTLEQIILDYKEKSYVYKVSTESEAIIQDPQVAQENLQFDHSLSGISDQPDLTVSIRSLPETSPPPYGSTNGRSLTRSSANTSGRGESTANGSCNGLDGHSHSDLFDHSIHRDVSSHSPLRSFLLLFALSLHSVFEGMAVGLQRTMDNVLSLFMVVIFHKGILALSLSVNMVQSRLSIKQIILSNLLFCVTAPIGVSVGLAVNEMRDSFAATLLSGVLQGLACGTFLYVTFFEVLPHEMNKGENRLQKLLFILLGFSIICLMLYISPENNQYLCYRV